ncbi:MarR family winged helix-turn-helix transcriptional regulator [Agarivorans gilvus]|uniref:MarR family transcriptional regulator n=1 Tax=Agarivorans gilvus TaxID=680279 RepID=A0ABQ1I7D5_9ALTE|nr:MarR family transcriptional regulator [Agarivorans gilvus]GGB18341.1 MarR family transcriptional regulator [Agarivorans gilvus]
MEKQQTVDRILEDVETNWPQAHQRILPQVLRLIRAEHGLRCAVGVVFDKYQLQGADYSALATLRRTPAPHCLPPTTLYHSMLFSSGGLTKVLNRLEQAELIERVANPEDKRSKLVKLSDLGKQLVEQVVVELQQAERQFMQPLSTDEQRQLNQLLAKLVP